MGETLPKSLPIVSVIIPVYNAEPFLKETLDSVLASTYHALEVIIIDDGSTDNSLEIAQEYADNYKNVFFYKQKNRGVSAARNNGISRSNGIFILPVDADDLISKEFIADAVNVLLTNSTIKVVGSNAQLFGNKAGKWRLPEFSLSSLTKRNMISCCSLFRKEDWIRVGGFCEQIEREDWAFWISVLKDGGDFVRLPQVGHFYRIHASSKRKEDRKKKKEIINKLNLLYPDFFLRELNGPLRYNRSWSKVINWIDNFINTKRTYINPSYSQLANFIINLPKEFDKSGSTIYRGRNELKKYDIDNLHLIVKSYKKPHFINRIIYGLFRKSKAERAYINAEKLLQKGIGTPIPIGYITIGNCFLFNKSYFVSLESTCPYLYNDLNKQHFKRKEDILKAIATTTALLHKNGFLHKDYSGGNILFDDREENIKIEIIDLNRMRFTNVDIQAGCKNFERLVVSPETVEILGAKYAEIRKYNKNDCISLIKKYNHSMNKDQSR